MTKTKIEWTDAVWNPVTGCTKVSPGCDNCYAERITERFHGPGSFAEVKLHDDKLDAPLRWRKPRMVFVNSMSDLFHDSIPDEFIARVWAVMAATPQHTYQILTKRHGRMRSLLGKGADHMLSLLGPPAGATNHAPWPLPNVWLGVSVEDQKRARLRIPALLETPAAVRFLSCEPLLGPVNLDDVDGLSTLAPDWAGSPYPGAGTGARHPLLDWVIAGGESGPGARPMHQAWARVLRDQCRSAGVPFFFKQWGQWAPDGDHPDMSINHSMVWFRSKKDAGRLLDGQTWDQFPAVVAGD